MIPATAPPDFSIPLNKKMDGIEVSCQSFSTEGFVTVFYSEPHALYISKPTPGALTSEWISEDKYNSFITNLVYTASISEFELPNEQVKSHAITIYSILDTKKFIVSSVPLFEGGIGFEFTHQGVYYNIRIDNEGDSVFYKEAPGQKAAGWDFTFSHLLRKMKSEF